MRMKQQACQAVGFTSSVVDLDAETSQDALSATIHQHTTDASVDGTGSPTHASATGTSIVVAAMVVGALVMV
jgi:hypothetical protein